VTCTLSKASVLLITKKALTGGGIYEKNIAEVLKDKYNFSVLKLDVQKYKLLKFKRLKYYFQVRLNKIHNPEILICSTAGLIAGAPLNKFKKKLLIVHHFDPGDSTNPIIKNFFHKIILSKLNRFDKVVVVSEYWKNYFSKYVDKDKIEIIYNSFNLGIIDNAIKNIDAIEFKCKYNIPLNKKIIYGGNSIRAKGIELLVKLLENSDFHIITSGGKDGDYGNQHLFLSYEEYLRLLKVSDVSVFLSDLREGWNRCAHESILCGTPVIGKNSAGLGELLVKSEQKIYDGSKNIVDMINEVTDSNKDVKVTPNFLKKFDLRYFENAWEKLIHNF